MTTQTPEKALVPYEELRSLVRSDDIQTRFQEVLGKNSRAFLASLLVLAQNDNLKNCDPKSMLIAAMKAATLSLPIDPAIGHAWIIPYRNGQSGRQEAQFQIGYKGLVQLAQRTRQYAIIHTGEIYEGQEIDRNQLTGAITISGAPTADHKVNAYFVYIKLLNGYEDYELMTVEEVIDHAKHYSKSWGKSGSPWSNEREFPKMAKKTVVKRLFNSGRLPISLELKTAIEEDETAPVIEGTPLSDFFEEIEGEATDVTNGDNGAVSSEPDFVSFLVNADLALDADTAEKMLVLCKITPLDEDKLRIWAKLVIGWIDATGCSLGQAAKYANKGEAPK